jgi:SAM-dependent methyltransferase
MAALAARTPAIYERNAERFDAERAKHLHEKAWLDRFADLLPPHATILDAGCGSGDPIARYLTSQGLAITGIDAAQAMIDLAASRFPDGEWLQTDMRKLDLGRRFHGVIGWNSFFHLTQDEQRTTLPRLAGHLAHGGAMMLTVGPESGEVTGHVGDDLVYHSSISAAEYQAILAGREFPRRRIRQGRPGMRFPYRAAGAKAKMTKILCSCLLGSLIGLVLLLQGCAQTGSSLTPEIKPQAGLNSCCTDMEDYPRWFVDTARTAAPEIGTVLSHVTWRGGYLKSKKEAQDAILMSLEPLDIVLVSSKGRTSGQLIPGLFGHAAIYSGTQAQLQALGVWSSAEIKAHAADITRPMTFIEADHEGVHLSPASTVLNTDRVAILRPTFSSMKRRRQVARDYFRHHRHGFRFPF